jgi:hypothetical protein
VDVIWIVNLKVQLKNLFELMLKKNKKIGEATKVHRRNEVVGMA